MSLSVKHLNADTSFLLTFTPPYAKPSQGAFPGSYTILIDPWLSGPSNVWTPKFASSQHVVPACVESLADLPEPDLVLISQDKTDHCHQQTLLQLPSDTRALILGTPAAAKKIRSWKHFDPRSVQPLRIFDERNPATIFRITIPPFSPSGSSGEVTISLLANKIDLTGLHNAIGITYRPPSSVLSAKTVSYVNLRQAFVASQNQRTSTPSPRSSAQPQPIDLFREKTISVIYTPHGLSYELVKDYASSHLLSEAALPLTALLHSFDRVTNPWYLGGNICAGSPGGSEIARNLFARAWISAHDEAKSNTGISVQNIKIERHQPDQVRQSLESVDSAISMGKARNVTEVVALDVGAEHVIAAR